jgi:hypothetical protein
VTARPLLEDDQPLPAGRGSVDRTFLEPEVHGPGFPGGRSPSGVVIDGVPYSLAGQPPIAAMGNWGVIPWQWRR